MYNDKYKDNYTAVVKALQKAREESPFGEFIILYIDKKNGLINIPFLELKDILMSLQNEGYIVIYAEPKMSAFLEQNEPHEWGNPYSKTDLFPRPLLPMNYFQIKLLPTFYQLAIIFGSPTFLSAEIPAGDKYNDLRKIAKLLIDNGSVENYKIAMKFKLNKQTKGKITKKDYFGNKGTQKKYLDKIENRLKTLRKIFQPHGYRIKFNKNVTELIKN